MYVPKFNTEEEALSWLNNLSLMELQNYFKIVADDTTLMSFICKSKNDYYINLRKKKDPNFPVAINANFGFVKTLGSHNYPELIPITKKLVEAFELDPQSYWNDLWEWYEKKYPNGYTEED